jgi:hypothetical protein
MTTTPAALSKSTIIQKIWENVYDRIKDNVTSVSITGSVTVTVQTYTNSFPDKPMDSKSDYPIIVISVPNLSWETLTLTKKWANGGFSIDVYTTQSEAADKLADAIQNSIEAYRDDLRAVSVHFINLDSTSADNFTRGHIKVHNRTLNFTFKYAFTGSL